MKKYFIAIALIFKIFIVSAQELNEETQEIVDEFISCIKRHNKAELAEKISYPLKREYPLPDIKNKQEFQKRYSEVFDEDLVKMIVNSNPLEDWDEVGYRGIMLLNGVLWLDSDGRLIAVNYQSEAERERRDELIKAEKNALHESIKAFERPIHILETSKFRVRIDDLGDGNYRYASWPLTKSMLEKPDIVLTKGEIIPDGSGGNHNYEFKNGIYKYECSIIVLGANDSPPAILTVYKGDKVILSQDAQIIK